MMNDIRTPLAALLSIISGFSFSLIKQLSTRPSSDITLLEKLVCTEHRLIILVAKRN